MSAFYKFKLKKDFHNVKNKYLRYTYYGLKPHKLY